MEFLQILKVTTKRLVELAKKINKSDEESLKQKKSLLEQARNQFNIGSSSETIELANTVKVQDRT